MTSPALVDHVETGAAQQAAGSSFYLAMRILPGPQREAMFQIYKFCREVDDIADSSIPHAQRLRQLAAWRSDIGALYAGLPPPKLRQLAQHASNFSLLEDDFLAVVDGMEMDAAEDIRAPTFDQLDLYCDRVASAVGRLSVRVFGMDEAEGTALAHHLGRALQLTNILRDLDEDAGMGRLYLPREYLQAAGIDDDGPAAVLAHPALARACRPVVDRARFHFAEADRIMARCPRATVRAPRIMAEVYRSMLAQMERRGWSPPRARIRVSRLKLLWVVLRHAFI
jgi:squalene synthase HpnD